jgi:hypothetical protein
LILFDINNGDGCRIGNMMIGILVHILKAHGVINPNNTVNVKFDKKLLAHPVLLAQVIKNTQFLRYNAPILVRIHCILQGWYSQPVCVKCGVPTKMRLSGRERFTFPRYCSGKCAAQDRDVQAKKEATNLLKYGRKHTIKY